MRKRQSVLFVEPDEQFKKPIKEMLEQSGYEVLTAGNGQEALTILSDTMIDLVISALRMPNVDGVELMQEINRTKKGIPVIFLTAYGDVETYMDLMNMGAFDYLDKSIKEQEILRAVRGALGGRDNTLTHYELSSA